MEYCWCFCFLTTGQKGQSGRPVLKNIFSASGLLLSHNSWLVVKLVCWRRSTIPSLDNFWTIGGQPTLEPPDLRDYLGRRLFFLLPSILFFFETEEGNYSLVLLTGSLWDIHQVKPNQFPEVSLIATWLLIHMNDNHGSMPPLGFSSPFLRTAT